MCRRGAQAEVLLWQVVLKQGLSHRETLPRRLQCTLEPTVQHCAGTWQTPSLNVQAQHTGCGSSPQVWVQPGPGRRDCVPPQGTYSGSARVIDNLRSLYSLGILTGVKVLVNYTR